MKILFFPVVILFLSIGCIRHNEADLPGFSFNDSTFLKFNIKNCTSSINLRLSWISVCPLEQSDVDILFERDTTMVLKLVVNHPVTITLAASEISAVCFSLPKDTLEVSIDFSLTEKNKSKIRFAGRNALISNYLTNYKSDISSSPKSFETVAGYTGRVEIAICMSQ